MATPPLTRRQVDELSIAKLALYIRKMVQQQASPELLEKQLRWKFRKTDGFQVAWTPSERIAGA